MSKQNRDLDVLIVGAGITGVALALVLHQAGLRVTVVDHAPLPVFVPSPGFDQRIYAMSQASAAFLGRAGGWQRMDPLRVQAICAMAVKGDRGGKLSLDSGEERGMGWIVESGAMLEGLLSSQRQCAPGLIRANFSVDHVEVYDLGVKVTLNTGVTLTADLLVAADGVNSVMRSRMGIGAHFYPYGQTAIVANYQTDRPHDGVARQWFFPGEILALLPLPESRVSLVWSAQADHARALMEMTVAERTTELQNKVGYGVGNLQEISRPAAFELRRMEVERWIGPRFALVGDAAHGVHPMAGQGLNLGLQDAACLAEVLLQRGMGPDCGDLSMLRRYERARQEPVAAMQGLTRGLSSMFSQATGPWVGLRNWGMNRVDGWNGVKNYLIHHANQ
ncbi:MAG: NAD-binding protein [Ferrovum sp.]|nr:NAD-binding protein [Ferrovum sp.]NDU88207.1 NAD-binding protein [Ferrovum sp.]